MKDQSNRSYAFSRSNFNMKVVSIFCLIKCKHSSVVPTTSRIYLLKPILHLGYVWLKVGFDPVCYYFCNSLIKQVTQGNGSILLEGFRSILLQNKCHKVVLRKYGIELWRWVNSMASVSSSPNKSKQCRKNSTVHSSRSEILFTSHSHKYRAITYLPSL